MANADRTTGSTAKATDAKAKDDRRKRLEEEAKKLGAGKIEARIVELQEELVILQRGPFVEYPKWVDGVLVHGPEEEENVKNPPKEPAPEAEARPAETRGRR